MVTNLSSPLPKIVIRIQFLEHVDNLRLVLQVGLANDAEPLRAADIHHLGRNERGALLDRVVNLRLRRHPVLVQRRRARVDPGVVVGVERGFLEPDPRGTHLLHEPVPRGHDVVLALRVDDEQVRFYRRARRG